MKDGRQTLPSYTDSSSGMTLRDYFAGQVLAGLMADANVNLNETENVKVIATSCYEIADAMLAASGKGEKNGNT